jgi:hypothetical protein
MYETPIVSPAFEEARMPLHSRPRAPTAFSPRSMANQHGKATFPFDTDERTHELALHPEGAVRPGGIENTSRSTTMKSASFPGSRVRLRSSSKTRVGSFCVQGIAPVRWGCVPSAPGSGQLSNSL